MKIQKWCKTGLKAFASVLTIVSLFTGTVHAQDKYTLNVQIPYGLTTNKNYKWATGFTEPVNNGIDSDVYAKFSINGQKVYCIDPLRATIHGAGDYSPQDLGTYTGSPEQAKRLGFISSLGYGFNGDTSDEMDYATQIRIWQEVRPGLVTHIHPDIQAKINQINERLRVYDTPVSFHKAEVSLYGYGKEYAQNLIDSNNVFQYYKLNYVKGIHCEQNGNTLKIWAEKGDLSKGGIMGNIYGMVAQGTSIAYVSPTSQNVAIIKNSDPNRFQVTTKVITGSIKVEKQDKETKEQAQGLGSLDSASYDVIRDDTGENMGTLTWESGKGSNEISGLYTRLPDGQTPISYKLVETKAPTGYHSGEFVENNLDNEVPFSFNSDSANENGIVDLTVTGYDSVSKIQLNKVDSKGNPVKGATLQLLDGETNKKVKFNYNETDSDDQKVWVTDGKPLEIRGLKVGHEYILQEIHAPNGVELARDVHFTVEENQEIQIVKMVDENEMPSIGTTASIDGEKEIAPKGK
ncbi:MSCRAMM family protein, partial [Faecalicoccus pleomorphus]|uniref:MSCRAMM family protein n=1 Tax=Faecalicoccus pleomorphus TaxID=1323 RepID=UPI0026EEEC0B